MLHRTMLTVALREQIMLVMTQSFEIWILLVELAHYNPRIWSEREKQHVR